MKFLRSLIALIIVIIILLAVIWWLHHNSNQPMQPQPSNITISTSQAKQQTWQQTVLASGHLVATKGTTLKNQADGTIIELHKKSGQTISKGTLLLALNNAVEAGQLKEAKANYSLSKITYERYKAVLDQGVTQQDLDEKKADMEANLGLYKQAQGEYELRFIKAPFSGKLGVMQVSVGDYVATGTTIVNLQNTSKLYVDFFVPERYANKININDTITLTSGVTGKSNYQGYITSIDSLINTNTGNIGIRGEVDNNQGKLIPGSYINVVMPIGDKSTVITVPQTAIVYDNDGNYVYTINNKVATKTTVTVGKQMGDDMIIDKGLTAGDEVISDGTNKVSDGATVTVDNKDKV